MKQRQVCLREIQPGSAWFFFLSCYGYSSQHSGQNEDGWAEQQVLQRAGCAKWAGGADPLLPLGPSGFLAGHCDGLAEILSKVTVCYCHTWERDLEEWTLFDLPSHEKDKAANMNSHQGYQLIFTHNETGKSNLLFLISNFSRKKSVINIKWKLS